MAPTPPTSHRALKRREGIDFTTLLLTAVASGAAAYITSKLWAAGTLPAAAATPVLVAIIREGLQRPTEVVARAVPPVRGMVRSADQDHDPDPDPQTLHAPLEPPRRVPQPGAVGKPPARWDQRWRLAIITGLLGFLVCAVVLTVPELVAGGAAGGGGRGTTLFGGDKEKRDSKRERDRTQTTTAPARTVTVPGRTVTAPPKAKASPAPTTTAPAPTQTAPPPTTTTPPPPP
jgi:hypothetical protein